MSAPIVDVLKNKLQRPGSELKYLQYTLHDTNIANFLRLLGYWEQNGYEKHVKFASNVRLELIREANKDYAPGEPAEPDVYLRIVYDNEDIKLPTCQHRWCTFDEFESFMDSHLLSFADASKLCN